MAYIIVLKVRKFGEDRLKVFEIFNKKLQGGAFCPPPTPNRVK